jgi:competence protein ComEA
MAEITPRQLAVCIGAALLAIVLGFSQLGHGTDETAAAPRSAAPIAVQEDRGGERLVIHVAGAVRRPGVYKLVPGARVDDAVARAGGATRRADLGGLNLAAKLEDGRQVLVPQRTARASAGAAGTAATTATDQPVNLNTATLEQLDTLSGIGPTTAQKILDFREEQGGFGSIEELDQISGIGEKTLAALREEVTL